MASAPAIRVIERNSTFTPLGIRFWDTALDTQIRAGLVVTARLHAERGGRRKVSAFRTASDIYAFQGLPGLRSIEHTAEAPGAVSSPPQSRDYIIEACDPGGQFVPVALRVELPLPYPGVLTVDSERWQSSPPLAAFPLYTAPTRNRPPWLAAIRGELVDEQTEGPAAHALAQLTTPTGEIHFTFADSQGRFAILFPYPPFESEIGGSPGGVEIPPAQQQWTIQVEVSYQPARQEPLPGTEIPDYYSILNQDRARVWEVAPTDGVAQDQWSGQLQYGRALVLRTAGMSQLLVSPPASSP